MSVSKFIATYVVEAIRYENDNVKEIEAFMGCGAEQLTDPGGTLRITIGWKKTVYCRKGNWIVRHPFEGSVIVISDVQFRSSHEAIRP